MISQNLILLGLTKLQNIFQEFPFICTENDSGKPESFLFLVLISIRYLYPTDMGAVTDRPRELFIE